MKLFIQRVKAVDVIIVNGLIHTMINRLYLVDDVN
ncbi:hypothetical protein LTSEHVI_2333, partial [Salmonella enterica subsp. enterica serovar Hvittingfoss str. A4-620]